MLLDVKKFMQAKYVANLEQIAAHIHQDPDLTRELLQHWIRKAKVEKLASPAGCGTRCQQCKPKYAEVYKWVG
jgi:hypothetical protein